MGKMLPSVAAVLATLLLGQGPASGEPTPGTRVELVTFGPGDQIYSRFGHSGLLVLEPGRPPQIYNFGLSDFDRRGLIWDFVRGEPLFWVAAQDWAGTLAAYRGDDRSVLLQRLRLDPAQTRALVLALKRAVRPENRTYVYHHFRDNCATRPRDLVDRVSGGRLGRATRGHAEGATLRDLMRRGFAGLTGLLLLTDLLVGRDADREVDTWQASFLPRVLSRAMAASGVAGPPRTLYRRRGPDPLAGDPLAGARALWGMAALAGLLAAAMVLWARRRRGRLVGLALLLLVPVPGLLGAGIWVLALLSRLPELRHNELSLVLWGTDLALLGPALAWLRGRSPGAGRLLRLYALVRLAGLALVLLGHAVGLLIQRPLAPVALALALALGLWLTLRLGRGAATSTSPGSEPRPGRAGAG
jgi:hypothetical protein